MTKSDPLIDTFKFLLEKNQFGSQAEIAKAMQENGFEQINQSKISRLIKKYGVIRTRNAKNQFVYSLPNEQKIPTGNSALKQQIVNIDYNKNIIVIKTTPGAAQLIALMLDSLGNSFGILGTIAGDDTIFITPKLNFNTKIIYEKIVNLFE